jgi:hypothetical protein
VELKLEALNPARRAKKRKKAQAKRMLSMENLETFNSPSFTLLADQ